MNKTIRNVFVEEINTFVNGSNTPDKEFLFDTTNAMIPGILVEYEDGDKILLITPYSPLFSYRDRIVNFAVEDYAWNDKLKRWDTTRTNTFRDYIGVTVNNSNLVDAATGKDKESFYHTVQLPVLDENGQQTGESYSSLELINPNVQHMWVGEFDFFMMALGKPALVPPLLATLREFFIKKHPDPVIDEGETIET